MPCGWPGHAMLAAQWLDIQLPAVRSALSHGTTAPLWISLTLQTQPARTANNWGYEPGQPFRSFQLDRRCRVLYTIVLL